MCRSFRASEAHSRFLCRTVCLAPLGSPRTSIVACKKPYVSNRKPIGIQELIYWRFSVSFWRFSVIFQDFRLFFNDSRLFFDDFLLLGTSWGVIRGSFCVLFFDFFTYKSASEFLGGILLYISIYIYIFIFIYIYNKVSPRNSEALLYDKKYQKITPNTTP